MQTGNGDGKGDEHCNKHGKDAGRPWMHVKQYITVKILPGYQHAKLVKQGNYGMIFKGNEVMCSQRR